MGGYEGSRDASTFRRRTLLIAMMLVLSLAACSTGETPENPVAGSSPSNEAETDPDRDDEKEKKEGGADDEAGGDAPGDPSGEGTENDDGNDPDADDNDDPEAEPGAVFVPDPAGDLERSGNPPGYIDIVSASIEDLGKAGRFTFEMGGDIPERMSDRNTTTIVEFRLKPSKRDEISINAVGDDQGWRAAIDARPIRGLELRGRTLEFVIAWNEIGNPSRFKWASHSSWSRNTALATEFGFDSAPNVRRANFRRG